MAQKTDGQRNKTRKKLSKHARDKDTITSHLKTFKEGDKVRIDVDPSIHRGIPDPKFHGKTATVTDRRGRAFIVEVDDRGKTKELTAYPSHLEEV